MYTYEYLEIFRIFWNVENFRNIREIFENI